jgi:catechol 2,3-dioxygenase-like lactoylglutathione lyase family enzyme
LPQTGFIDHIGIGVPELGVAKAYYDDLMSVLGLREWFVREPGDPLNYGPDGGRGAQLFFYRAEEPAPYSRGHTGPSSHRVPRRQPIDRPASPRVGPFPRGRHSRRTNEFPQYGEHCYATYWLDPHGFKLEAVCHSPEETTSRG